MTNDFDDRNWNKCTEIPGYDVRDLFVHLATLIECIHITSGEIQMMKNEWVSANFSYKKMKMFWVCSDIQKRIGSRLYWKKKWIIKDMLFLSSLYILTYVLNIHHMISQYFLELQVHVYMYFHYL